MPTMSFAPHCGHFLLYRYLRDLFIRKQIKKRTKKHKKTGVKNHSKKLGNQEEKGLTDIASADIMKTG